MNMTKTIKELAQDALDVQNACNLCGVAQSFARAMVDLGKYTNGTTERNRHPIAILWADKIANLTGTQEFGNDRVMEAYDSCYAIVNAPDAPVPSAMDIGLGGGSVRDARD